MRVLPAIYTDQRAGIKFPSGLFQGLALGRLKQGFSQFPVARRLVEHLVFLNLLLDQEEFFLALDYGCDGYMGMPAHRDTI